MDASNIQADLLALLRGRYSSLTIGFNEHHAADYMTAQECGRYTGDEDDFIAWASNDERLKAIGQNSVWTIQWYPDTPIGSYCVGASSLSVALLAAVRVAKA